MGGLVTADVKLSTSQVYLPPKDEAAEFDDHGVDLAGHVDDKDLVVWRKNNKVGLRMEVTPSASGKQIIGLGIQYQYTNTVFALGKLNLIILFLVYRIYLFSILHSLAKGDSLDVLGKLD